MDAKAPAATPPTVAKAAAAAVNSAGVVTGKSTALSVLGNDARGASTLLYGWTITSLPAGGSAKFSINGSNAAQNDTVTFSEAGVYGISVTIVDGSGLSVSSSLKVTVVQTPAGMNLYSGAGKVLVNPNAPLNVTGTSQTLTAVALDQFGNALATQPALAWSAISYPGGAMPSFSTNSSTRTVTFTKAGPYVVSVAAGAGGGGGGLRRHCRTHDHRRQPGGRQRGRQRHVRPIHRQSHRRPVPQPAGVGCHADLGRRQRAGRGRGPAVRFQRFDDHRHVLGGRHVRAQRHADRQLHDVVSQSIAVLVGQTLTSIVVTPGTAGLQGGATQQYNAQGFDQFQRAMAAQPAFAWKSSGGAISSAGLFTAPATAGTYSISAARAARLRAGPK